MEMLDASDTRRRIRAIPLEDFSGDISLSKPPIQHTSRDILHGHQGQFITCSNINPDPNLKVCSIFH